MTNVILITTGVLIILGLTVELATIAEDASNKALMFSEDMNNALDCAFEGRPIEECSPNLMVSGEFEQDATGFMAQVEQVDAELQEALEEIEELEPVQ